MENDQGTRGLPASDGPLQGFFGGARRCAERATNLYAGQDGGSPSGEFGRLKEMIARLEIQSASYEGRWQSVLKFAKKRRPRHPGKTGGWSSCLRVPFSVRWKAIS